jgi:hypothetical protein
MLKAYGVSLKDRRIYENLLQDLYVLNKKVAKSGTLVVDSEAVKHLPLFMYHLQKAWSRWRRVLVKQSGFLMC